MTLQHAVTRRARPSLPLRETGLLRSAPGHRRRSRAGGYSVLELVITLALTTVVVIGIGQFIDRSQVVFSGQMSLAEMQQSARRSLHDLQYRVRMLGRGGFPASSNLRPLPDGLSVSVIDSVPADQQIVAGSSPVIPKVIEGTDILIVRGVFTSPIYQVNHTDRTTFKQLDDDPRQGDLKLSSTTPTGVPQDLSAVIDVVQRSQANPGNPIQEALLVTSPLDPGIYAVVELEPLASDITDPANIKLRFRLSEPLADPNQRLANQYDRLNPGGSFPLELFESGVGFVGILEEHRYYVRREYQIPGDNSTRSAPRLSRARVFPATEIPYRRDDTFLAVDVAAYVMDFQVAIGCDTTNSDPALGGIEPTPDAFALYEAPDGKNDDWLFNGLDDDPDAKPWNNLDIGDDYPTLYFLRVTALVQSREADRGQEAPWIDTIENHSYAADPLNSFEERRYRRTVVQTVVDLRNLG